MRIALTLVLGGWFSVISAQVPEGYYADVDDTNAANLRASLHQIVKTGAIVRSYANVITILQDANQDPNNPNNIILIYSGISVDKTWDSGVTWDREHVFPQSKFGGVVSPYHTDVHALMPTIPAINNRRSNHPFGVVPVGGNPDQYGNKLGTGLGGFTVFEPRDGAKGDVARALFFMDIRYEGTNGELNLFLSDVNPDFAEMGRLSELIQWHFDDPPDAWEIRRNDRLYAAQNNRNPFIDYPQFVDCVYLGNCTGEFALPAPPQNLVATEGVTYVDLDWDANTEPDLVGYRVYRAQDTAGPFDSPLVEIEPPVNSYRDTTGTPGDTYFYHVTATNTRGFESAFSNQVVATPIVDVNPPVTPAGFQVFGGNGFVYIQWIPNEEADLDGYRLYRSTMNPPVDVYQVLGVDAAGFLDENVTNGTRYFYAVSAFDTSNNESDTTTVESAVPGSAGTGCGIDLIFSEYAKGSVGFNRALELYNPTGAAIDLGTYTIDMYSGASASPVVQLSLAGRGVLPPLETFVIVHQSATDSNLLARADMADAGNSLWFNGDDPIVLRRGETVIDSIGQVGSADVYGNNVTLRRKPDVFFGRSNAADPFVVSEEWLPFPVNTWTGLGGHDIDCEIVTGISATIELMDSSPTDRDAVRFEVAFSSPVAGMFDLSAVGLSGTLAGGASTALAGSDPVYTVVAVLDDPNADGTIGITVGGGGLDAVEGGFEPAASALYTIANRPLGDITGDGLVNVEDVTALARWIVEGLPPEGPSPE